MKNRKQNKREELLEYSLKCFKEGNSVSDIKTDLMKKSIGANEVEKIVLINEIVKTIELEYALKCFDEGHSVFDIKEDLIDKNIGAKRIEEIVRSLKNKISGKPTNVVKELFFRENTDENVPSNDGLWDLVTYHVIFKVLGPVVFALIAGIIYFIFSGWYKY